MAVEGIQAYGKCLGCAEIIWCEFVSNPSDGFHDQACGCVCGDLSIVNDEVTGDSDPAFDDTAMQAVLDTLP